jgi:hypothetical protein
MVITSICHIIETNREQQQYDITVKVVGNVSKGYYNNMKQWGVLADNSGMIRFTSWVNFNGADIEPNVWYEIHNARYRYNNFTPNLILDSQTSATKLHSDEVIEELDPIEFDYNLPYQIVRVRGICLRINPHAYPNIKQKGWIGNAEQFEMPFTMFNSGGHTSLEVGKIYDIQYASVEYFHDKRELYVDCAQISEIPPQDYSIDSISPFFEIDHSVTNAQSKRIFPHIYSTAQSICGLSPEMIEEKVQLPLIAARMNYEQMMIIDYTNRTNQLAYMFGYFPYYIELIREVFSFIPKGDLDRIIRQGLKVNFYGCGPTPELLGFIRFISEKYPGINQIQATFIDGNSWHPWRSCVINNISKEYWNGKIVPTEVEDDLLNLPSSHLELIADADIHCIQNVCSDLMKRVATERVVNWLTSIYRTSKTNSLMAVIDIHYSSIRTLLFDPTVERIKNIHNDAKIFTSTSFRQANLDFVPSMIDLPTKRQSNGYRYMAIIKNRGD